MKSGSALGAILLLPAIAAPAAAQDASAATQATPGTSNGVPTAPAAEPGSAATSTAPFTIAGSAALMTQYRFRGISQSDNKPVVQGAFTVTHRSGLYISTWGSSASGNRAVDLGGTEIDVFGGYTHALGKSGLTIDAGLYGYIYPGSRKAVGISESYYEIYGSLAKTVGPIGIKAGAYWAPNQDYFHDFATRSRYSVYEYGELTASPKAVPLTFHAHVGHTGGGLDYAGHDYLDYTVGAGYKWKALTFDVSLVGTSLSRADTRAADLLAGTDDYHRAAKSVAVGSITASF